MLVAPEGRIGGGGGAGNRGQGAHRRASLAAVRRRGVRSLRPETRRQLMIEEIAAMWNSAQAIADPYPKSNSVNAWLSWESTIVILAPPAPPMSPSSTCGSVERLSPPMVDMMTVNRMMGRSIGTVIRKNTWTMLAPTTFAAS